MSYQAPEWVRPMTKERWGRLIEDREKEGGGAGLVWSPNNRPLELANEYLTLVEWTQHLETALLQSTKLLDDINTRLGDLSISSLAAQLRQSKTVLDASPADKKQPTQNT